MYVITEFWYYRSVEAWLASIGKRSKMRENRKRDIDSSILNAFWELADISDEKRLKGAEQILVSLQAKQHQSQVILRDVCKTQV